MLAAHITLFTATTIYYIFKASQPRGQSSSSRAYERHEMQGVILKCIVLGMNIHWAWPSGVTPLYV